MSRDETCEPEWRGVLISWIGAAAELESTKVAAREATRAFENARERFTDVDRELQTMKIEDRPPVGCVTAITSRELPDVIGAGEYLVAGLTSSGGGARRPWHERHALSIADADALKEIVEPAVLDPCAVALREVLRRGVEGRKALRFTEYLLRNRTAPTAISAGEFAAALGQFEAHEASQ